MTGRAYLVKGSDPLLRDGALDVLIDDVLDGVDRSFAVEEFVIGSSNNDDGDEEDAGEVRQRGGRADGLDPVVQAALDAASSPPFMTPSRVVVVREAGALTAAGGEAFARYLDAPLDTTVLVFVAGGGTIPAALTKKLKAVDVEERSPAQEKTGDVLKAAAKAAGVRFTNDAAQVVATHLGEDAGRVETLVEVLASAREPGTLLDADDVAPYLGGEGSVPMYQLTNAIEAGDTAGALAVLHRLLTVTSAKQPKPAHPLQLMGMLASYYRKLLRLDDPSLRTPADAIEALGGKVKEFPARKALDAARTLGTDGIRQAFDALSRADLDLKGARAIPQEAVMEVLVVRLARLSASATPGRRR